MPETRTVALTDAERVNLLLDENQRLRDELNASRVVGEVLYREAAATDRTVATERTALQIAVANYSAERSRADQAGANVRDQRASLADAHDRLTRAITERCDAQVAQYAAEAECEQLRRELAKKALGAPLMVADLAMAEAKPSHMYTLGHLVGVAIGAGLVGCAIGLDVAAVIVGRLPW